MLNEELYEEAMAAITALFGDTSVSQFETERNLNDLIGEIKTMMNSLEGDER